MSDLNDSFIIYSTMFSTENSGKQRGTYRDKIHRLDTSIINKISQMRKQQICKNKRIGTNWVLE